jgi:hypothetical protein
MHAFDADLLPKCAEFTLSHSRTVRDRILVELQTSSRTPLVRRYACCAYNARS